MSPKSKHASLQSAFTSGSQQLPVNPVTTAPSSSPITMPPVKHSNSLKYFAAPRTPDSGLVVDPPSAHSASPQVTGHSFLNGSDSAIGTGAVTTPSFDSNSASNSPSFKSLSSCPHDTFQFSCKNHATAVDSVVPPSPSPTTKEISASDSENSLLLNPNVDGILSKREDRSNYRKIPAKGSVTVRGKNLSSLMSITTPSPSTNDDLNSAPLNLSTAVKQLPSTCIVADETVNPY